MTIDLVTPLRPGCVKRCPGCSHRDKSEAESLQQKQNWLESTLHPHSIEKIRSVSGEARWGYREKTTLHASWNGRGWDIGMKKSLGVRSEYEVVAIPDCPVHSSKLRSWIKELSRLLPAPEGFPLRFVAIAGNLLTLVLKASPSSESSLDQRLPTLLAPLGFDGIYLNFNPSAGERVFSSRGWKLIAGNATSERSGHCGGTLVHGPESFQQLIPSLYEDALEEAKQFFKIESGDLVLDFYSGLGVSMNVWLQRGAETVGVELVGEAIRCASQNLPVSVPFFQGRVSDRIVQVAEIVKNWRSRLQPDSRSKLLVFVNPPRTGMEEDVVQWLCSEAIPDRMVYLSCSAGTLRRDLSLLSEANPAYGVRRIIPYDFFPQTHHIEALACVDLDSGRSLADPSSI